MSGFSSIVAGSMASILLLLLHMDGANVAHCFQPKFGVTPSSTASFAAGINSDCALRRLKTETFAAVRTPFLLERQKRLLGVETLFPSPLSMSSSENAEEEKGADEDAEKVTEDVQKSADESAEKDVGEDDEEDEEDAEPGTMRVSEIKAELQMRGVDFSDCFDKESLAQRLKEARTTGKADPSVIDNLNKKKIEANYSGEEVPELTDEQINSVVSGDGSLPGGMTPDMLRKLMSNPELMQLMQSVKMQEVMKLVMMDGKEALEKKMREDEEIRELVGKLNEEMGNAL